MVYYTTNLASDNITYYIRDGMIESETAISDLIEIIDVNQNDIVVNTPLISNEVIKVYMENSTTILLSFVVISILSMSTSLISTVSPALESTKRLTKRMSPSLTVTCLP